MHFDRSKSPTYLIIVMWWTFALPWMAIARSGHFSNTVKKNIGLTNFHRLTGCTYVIIKDVSWPISNSTYVAETLEYILTCDAYSRQPSQGGCYCVWTPITPTRLSCESRMYLGRNVLCFGLLLLIFRVYNCQGRSSWPPTRIYPYILP